MLFTYSFVWSIIKNFVNGVGHPYMSYSLKIIQRYRAKKQCDMISLFMCFTQHHIFLLRVSWQTRFYFLFLCYKLIFISQVTAVHPVGEGQCVALGYESALPLILLTLQGGDMKPCEFPNEGTKAMAGTGMITKSTTTTTSIFLNVNTNIKILWKQRYFLMTTWSQRYYYHFFLKFEMTGFSRFCTVVLCNVSETITQSSGFLFVFLSIFCKFRVSNLRSLNFFLDFFYAKTQEIEDYFSIDCYFKLIYFFNLLQSFSHLNLRLFWCYFCFMAFWFKLY